MRRRHHFVLQSFALTAGISLALFGAPVLAADDKVNSSELMKAMMEGLKNPKPADAGATAPAPATNTQAPVQKVAPNNWPVDTSQPVKTIAPIKKDSYAADQKAPPAPEAKPEDKKPESPAAGEPVKKAEEPKKSDSSAPLLTDLNEAPSGTVKPSATKADDVFVPAAPEEKAEPAPQMSGLSKSRPIFSSPGEKKRKGVIGKGISAAPVAEAPTNVKPAEEKQAAEIKVGDTLPPVAPAPAAKEKPKAAEVKKETSKAAEEVEGEVLHSQSVDDKEEKKDAAKDIEVPSAADPNTEKKIIEPIETPAELPLEVKPLPPEPKIEPKDAPKDIKPSALKPPKFPAASHVVEKADDVNAEPMAAMPVATRAGAMQGSCGAANGIGTATKPASNLCTQGTASAVSGKGPWNWSCAGENGGKAASCSAPLQINGECGMANGSQAAVAPIGGLCASGKASDVTGNGPWYWNCFGDNGGVVAQCVAYTLVSGQCGPAHNVATASAPTSGLCNSGKETTVLGDGPWNWSCEGSGEGTSVKCMAGVLASGSCGPAHGLGSADKPTEGLCASGTASDVSGNGPWDWTCFGDNGGAKVNCMAPMKLDGVCGPAHMAGAGATPTEGLCATGAPSQVLGSGPWQWSCAGAGGGITANCMANPQVNAECGAAHGVSTSAAPTEGLCSNGKATSIIGSGPWMWSCQGEHGGAAVNCMAPIQVNGACGAADSVAAVSAPSDNLCRTGTASTISGNGPWTWNCVGAGGGMSVPCHAPMQPAQKVEKAAAAPAPAPAPETSEAETPAEIPADTAKAGNECTPTVKRWTITCQQGGYPANYTGVIVGETQTLCPMNVERGVWLSNSCAPATESAPVSPSPGKLETPKPPSLPPVGDTIPDIPPLPARAIEKPKKLVTPRLRDTPRGVSAAQDDSIRFNTGSEALDSGAVGILSVIADMMTADDRSIATLSAYAAMPADNNQQEARRISLARALAVRSYLMRKGINSNRIDIRALGPAGDGKGDDRVDIKVK